MSLMNETMTLLQSADLTSPHLYGDEASPSSPRRSSSPSSSSPLSSSRGATIVADADVPPSPLLSTLRPLHTSDSTPSVDSVEEANKVRVIFRILRGKTVEVSIDRSTTVAEIKAALPALQHVHCKLVKLIHGGKMMGLHQSMDDCGVTDGSIIHVLVLV